MSVGKALEVFAGEVLELILRAELSEPTVLLTSDGGLWRVDMVKFELWRGQS